MWGGEAPPQTTPSVGLTNPTNAKGRRFAPAFLRWLGSKPYWNLRTSLFRRSTFTLVWPTVTWVETPSIVTV